jgi:hypothetical protein
MKNLKKFSDFTGEDRIEEKSISPKKGFMISTNVQDSIKKLCEEMLHPEAKACHEDEMKEHTYESYIKECGSYMQECMNECMGKM